MQAPDSILGISLSVFLIAFAQNNQQQEAQPKVIRKSDAELKAAAITRVSPEPTSIAKAAKASGKVEVEVMIDESGNVVSAEAITGNALLRGVARDAARQWKFNPALLSEKPTKVTGVITFDFEAEPPTREDQESLQSFVASIGRPGYAAPTTPEAAKKLRLAEEAVDRFIERFHQTLDFGVLFDEVYVSNRAQRRRNIYFILSTAPNNHLGWEKKFDEAIVREGFIAFMNEYLLNAEYALTLPRSQKRVVPPEIVKAAKALERGRSGDETLAGMKEFIAKTNRLSSLYRKYLSPAAFDSQTYKANRKEALKALTASGIVNGFRVFGVGEDTEVYYVERHIYKLFLIEEEGALKVLMLGFAL